MKKFIKQLVIALILISFGLTLQMAVTNAQDAPPPDVFEPIEFVKGIGEQTQLPGFVKPGEQHPDTFDYMPGVGAVTSPIYYVLDIFRYAVSGIALIVIITAAIKLVSTSTDEEATKQKSALVIGVIGLFVIQMADVIVKKMFFGEFGEAFEDVSSAQYFGEETISQLRGIIGFIQILVGSFAVMVIVIRGFTLVYDAGEEESIATAKTHITYALVGLAFIGLSEVVVRGFIFPDYGESLPNIEIAKKIVKSLTNYISGFMALFAFGALFLSGYRYVISGGNEEANEKVKKTLIGGVIALVISLGAYAAVNTFITLDETDINENNQEVSMLKNNYLI